MDKLLTLDQLNDLVTQVGNYLEERRIYNRNQKIVVGSLVFMGGFAAGEYVYRWRTKRAIKKMFPNGIE